MFHLEDPIAWVHDDQSELLYDVVCYRNRFE